MSVDKKKLVKWLRLGKNVAGPATLQWVIDHVEKGEFDTTFSEIEIRKDDEIIYLDDSQLDDITKEFVKFPVSDEDRRVKMIVMSLVADLRNCRSFRDALQEERDHLLAANDEFQEKLRFEEEEEDQPICFKMDANGNLTRV